MAKWFNQLMRFGVVGMICFIIDYTLMIALTELCAVNYLFSSGISFSVSVIINYWLSMHFVFQGKKYRHKTTELMFFIILSLSGLFLTELLIWLLVEKTGLLYRLAKIVVTLLVMIYNFVTKKIFLENKTKN